MAVVKATARLYGDAGALMGEGRAYLHLRLPADQQQPASGTLSLDWWDDDGGAPRDLALVDGPLLRLEVDADRLSGCLVGRILRYRTLWPGTGGEGATAR